jgi:uncharacterized protein (DUF58 family)
MREGDDPRDIYWRKSTRPDGLVLRERAREVHQAVEFVVDVLRTPVSRSKDADEPAEGDRHEVLERHIRKVASHAVAHIKRGDRVTIVTTAGERVRSDLARGIDPLLRFLALLELVDAPPAPRRGRTSEVGRAA